jgi:hypothetical protein
MLAMVLMALSGSLVLIKVSTDISPLETLGSKSMVLPLKSPLILTVTHGSLTLETVSSEEPINALLDHGNSPVMPLLKKLKFFLNTLTLPLLAHGALGNKLPVLLWMSLLDPKVTFGLLEATKVSTLGMKLPSLGDKLTVLVLESLLVLKTLPGTLTPEVTFTSTSETTTGDKST